MISVGEAGIRCADGRQGREPPALHIDAKAWLLPSRGSWKTFFQASRSSRTVPSWPFVERKSLGLSKATVPSLRSCVSANSTDLNPNTGRFLGGERMFGCAFVREQKSQAKVCRASKCAPLEQLSVGFASAAFPERRRAARKLSATFAPGPSQSVLPPVRAWAGGPCVRRTEGRGPPADAAPLGPCRSPALRLRRPPAPGPVFGRALPSAGTFPELLPPGSVLLTLSVLECNSKSIRLTDKEIECFSQSRIYHAQTDKCYKLLTRGPCQPGFWFVLEKPKKGTYGKYPDLKINAICVQEKCPEGGYYWSSTKTCVQPKDKNLLCGSSSDEELLNNVFGEAECMCARDPLRARLDGDERSRCYQLYTRGPCRPREVIAFAAEEAEKATCLEDKCHEERIRRQREGTLSADAVLAPWKNGSCYELGTQGPCTETLKFKVHETTLQPDCVTLTNAIFDLEKPQKCYQDENGDCQKRINSGKAQSAEKYREELLSSISAARKRRHLVPGT